jgi:hypothetical protein
MNIIIIDPYISTEIYGIQNAMTLKKFNVNNKIMDNMELL